MFQFKKNKCICDTVGKIVKVSYGDEECRRVTVEYVVDNCTYQLKENITVKSTAIKLGGIPIGQRKVEYITAGLGEEVAVKYNPQKPTDAYLRDNIGKYM